MNKIIVDNNINHNDIFIDKDSDLIVNLEDSNRDINIHLVRGICVRGFIITKNTKNKVTYNIEDECNVVINKLAIDSSDSVVINFNDVNSKVKYYTSIINYENNVYKESINHIKSDTESKIVNHCINVYDKEFSFVVDGIVKKDCNRVNFKQDNKIINLNNGKSSILPNLIVDSVIEASHSAYIGTFDEEKKFYMMSRGLTEKECDDLLIKAFLLNEMNLSDKERDIYCEIIEKINRK